MKKFLAYKYIIKNGIYKSHLGVPNLLILIVTPTEAKIKKMMETISSISETNGSLAFFFNTISVIGHDCPSIKPAPDLYQASRHRAGKSNFILKNVDPDNQ